jgi:hypothetical protein
MIRLTEREVRHRGGKALGGGRKKSFLRDDIRTPFPEKGAELTQQLAVIDCAVVSLRARRSRVAGGV